jgi:hypothetical protein
MLIRRGDRVHSSEGLELLPALHGQHRFAALCERVGVLKVFDKSAMIFYCWFVAGQRKCSRAVNVSCMMPAAYL